MFDYLYNLIHLFNPNDITSDITFNLHIESSDIKHFVTELNECNLTHISYLITDSWLISWYQ